MDKLAIESDNSRVRSRVGFTLIELAISLVIIGLLVGGVMVGKSLIRASEIRSVITQQQGYVTALNTFELKYNCVPGDCANATDFFGAQDPNPTTCRATASTGMLTCNGNGNGQVASTNNVADYYEYFRFWQQLAIAGLINGQYTGVTGPSGTFYDHQLGVNAPISAISGAGFAFRYWGHVGGSSTYYSMTYGNHFVFGGATTSVPATAVFTPAEAQNFDIKIDNGKPATGLVIARSGYVWGDPNACTTSASNTDYQGLYNTLTNVISCSLVVRTGEY